MKLFILGLMIGLSSPVFAQQSPEAILSNFYLPDDKIQVIQAIIDKNQQQLQDDRADIAEAQAELAAQMYKTNPDWPAIEKILHRALQGEYRARLILIQRTFEVKKQLGRDTWVQLFKARRALQQITKRGERPLDFTSWRLIRLLREFR